MKNYFRYCCVLSCFFCSLYLGAQQPLNLGFEKISIEGRSRPWGWEIESMGAGALLRVDSSTKHRGDASLAMQAGNGIGPVIGYAIEPYSFSGKQTLLTGWCKASSKEVRACLIVGYVSQTSETEVLFDTVKHVTLSGGWEPIQASVCIPQGARSWFLKLSCEGTGTVWFDDFSASVGGKIIREAEVAPAFDGFRQTWVLNHTKAFRSTNADQPQALPATDLLSFEKICSKATIIAAGESTHGTSEFFRLKHRLFEFAVKKLGVRVFAIEDNQVIVERVNRYVGGGAGTARSSMNGMFSVWQNKEVEAMIQWIRDYNDFHKEDKIVFAGFDIQHLRSPADSLLVFLKRKDAQLCDTVSVLLKDMLAGERTHFAAPDSSKLQWWQHADKAYRLLSGMEHVWLSGASRKADSAEIHKGIQYANLVRQYARNLLLGHLSLYRDTAMAENVSWILSQQKSGTKMFIWAHDMHISRGEHPVPEQNMYNGISMGAHLSKKYGKQYRAFGLSSYTGAYWGQVSYSDFRQTSCMLLPAPRGSLDESLHRIAVAKKQPYLFLDLTSARSETWFDKPIPVRFANHVNIEYGYWTRYSVPYQFDGIFFIDVTGPADSYAR